MREESRCIALCGMFCALAVAIMSMGTLIPAATYACPVLAGLTLVPVLILCGKKYAWLMYAASAMLSLLLAPDKEAAMIFLALGYYPIVKPGLDRKKKLLRAAMKVLLFHAAVFAAYAALLFVLQMDALRQEMAAMQWGMLLALLVGGNLVFWMNDLLLSRITPRVAKKLQKYH